LYSSVFIYVTKKPFVRRMLSVSVCQSGNLAFQIQGLPEAGVTGQTILQALPENSKSYLTNPFQSDFFPGKEGRVFETV
jgi:hypothetical protein